MQIFLFKVSKSTHLTYFYIPSCYILIQAYQIEHKQAKLYQKKLKQCEGKSAKAPTKKHKLKPQQNDTSCIGNHDDNTCALTMTMKTYQLAYINIPNTKVVPLFFYRKWVREEIILVQDEAFAYLVIVFIVSTFINKISLYGIVSNELVIPFHFFTCHDVNIKSFTACLRKVYHHTKKTKSTKGHKNNLCQCALMTSNQCFDFT